MWNAMQPDDTNLRFYRFYTLPSQKGQSVTLCKKVIVFTDRGKYCLGTSTVV